MMPKFTTGPWEVRAIKEHLYVGSKKMPVAMLNNDVIPPEEAAANGRLMAAGPEMYDALVGQVNNWKSQTCPMFINSGTEPEQCYYCANKECEAARQIKTIRELLARIDGKNINVPCP